MTAVLGDPEIGDFSVSVALNEPSYRVQPRIEEFFAEASPDDLVLLHLSCHGLKSDAGELFFAAADTRPMLLMSTAIPAAFVRGCMNLSRSRRVVLLLDCCYGGAFRQGAEVRGQGDVDVLGSFRRSPDEGGGRGRAVITASSAMEYAFEGAHLSEGAVTQPSVFTHAVVEGLRTGAADRDEDGLVSLDELYDYVYDQVKAGNPAQTPSRSFDVQGEIYIARSRRRRVRPAELPPDLQGAVADGNPYARLGAIAELRARLRSDNLAIALSALAVLRQMVEHDVQSVSNSARSALADLPPPPPEIGVDLGSLAPGSPMAEQHVPIDGPALARALVVGVLPPWLDIQVDGDGLRVRGRAVAPGPLFAAIDVDGPLGRTTIRVTATVEDDQSPEPAPQRASQSVHAHVNAGSAWSPAEPKRQAFASEVTMVTGDEVEEAPERSPFDGRRQLARWNGIVVAVLILIAVALALLPR